MKLDPSPRLAPSHIILISSIITMAIGTLLLSLPIAVKQPLPFLDIIFTAISAATGTGMFTISLESFTPFGLTVIIALIQIGALGLLVLTLSLAYIFFEFETTMELLIAQVLDIEKRKNIKKIIFSILSLTFAIELIGAMLLYQPFRHEFGATKGWWYALFHSISAFSNAGVTLFKEYSIFSYRQDIYILSVFAFLMLAGMIGFVTLREALRYIPAKIRGKKYTLSLVSKIIISTTTILILTATVLLFVLEDANALAAESSFFTALNAFINGIGGSGSGFSTVYMTSLRPASLLIIMILAFIGTAPGSTGSGIKTTTAAISLASVRAVIQGKNYVTLFGQRIPREQVRKAVAIISVSIPWVMFATFLLLIFEPEFTFLQVLFESVSAFATLGLSTNITPHLSSMSKIVLMANMIFGRIGPFTMIFAIKKVMAPPTDKEAVLFD